MNVSTEGGQNLVENMSYSVICFYCQHGYDQPIVTNTNTTFKCEFCKVPLCKPSKEVCRVFPIVKGLPKK